jgi:hypothetical protein
MRERLRKPTGRELGTGLAVVSVIALLAFVPSDVRDEDTDGAVEVAAGQDGTTPTTLHDHQKMLRDIAARHHHHGDAAASDDSAESHDHSSTSDAHASHDTSASAHTSHDTSTHTTHDATTHTGHTATQIAAHDHSGTTGATATEHNHTSTPTGNPTNPSHNHHPTTPGSTVPGHQHPTTPTPTGPITSLSDPRLTAQQKADAQALIDRTKTGMAPLMTSAAVLAAGYTWINDRAGGFRHYVNFGYLSDGHELDPNRIESIVMQEQPGGGLKIVSALYILELGKTMANVPNIAGSLTTWHIHTNLCWRNNVIVGTTGPDHCPIGSTSIITPPMLHVWLPGAPAQPCGPFAGLGEHGGGDCSHEH